MSFLKFLLGEKKKSNDIAKERLKLILVSDRRADSVTADFLPQLQRELIDVISKYIKINPDDIKVNLDKQGSLEVLEVKIEMSADESANA